MTVRSSIFHFVIYKIPKSKTIKEYLNRSSILRDNQLETSLGPKSSLFFSIAVLTRSSIFKIFTSETFLISTYVVLLFTKIPKSINIKKYLE